VNPAAGDEVSGSLAIRRWFPWLVALAALFVFAPIVFLRYEFHDSWAWLYWMNGSRRIDGATPCLELGTHHYLIGRPLMPAILCAMTVFGPEIGLVWIPKLFALLLLLGAGALVLAVFRGVGAGAAVGALALGSALFLPGFVLMIAMMVANAIAWAAFAAVLAGFIWWKVSCGPKRGLAARGAAILAALALIVAAMATDQIVATMFFLPLLVAIIFSGEKASGAALLKSAAGAAVLFAAAALVFVVAHGILLHDFGYFLLPMERVAQFRTSERSVSTVAGLADLGEKFAFLSRLGPRIFTLWFVSEHATVHPVAAWGFGLAAAASLAVFAWRVANPWRVLALLLVVACFFGPYAVSHNAGNGLYQLERVKVFMQIPFVLLFWGLIHWMFARGWWPLRAAACAMALVAAFGMGVSWLVVMRARVIPNYMELKHVAPRVRDAVRRDVKHIYIIRAEDAHLRATIGVPGGDEIGRITSFYFPHQMVHALLLEIEKTGTARRVTDVDADKAHTIPAGGPEKLVLDMRKFP
jgi:hypothetical protein